MYLSRVAVVPLLVIAIAMGGCGESSESDPLTGRVLSEEIAQLSQGLSEQTVIDRLGEPLAEFHHGSDTELSYGAWQLSFVNDELQRRSLVFAPQHGQRLKQTPKLERTILRLRLGSSIADVEAWLGIPQVVYVIYEDDPSPIKVLRYGPWQLTFVDGRLEQRAQ